jgi:hypothetical protein
MSAGFLSKEECLVKGKRGETGGGDWNWVRDVGERIGLWGFEKKVFRRLRKEFSAWPKTISGVMIVLLGPGQNTYQRRSLHGSFLANGNHPSIHHSGTRENDREPGQAQREESIRIVYVLRTGIGCKRPRETPLGVSVQPGHRPSEGQGFIMVETQGFGHHQCLKSQHRRPVHHRASAFSLKEKC